MYSLRKLIWMAFIVVGLLLGCVALLGLSQYRLSAEYTQVLNRNERVLFNFMTIRESLTEVLIKNSWSNIDKIVAEIEKLNSEVTRLKENKMVSDELKLALVNNVDLAGLVILLRSAPTSGEDLQGKNAKIQTLLRSMSDYLIQYDRIMVTQARERIVHFQKVVIGVLGLIISLASLALILLYRNTVAPLLFLTDRLREGTEGAGDISFPGKAVEEVAELSESVRILVERASEHETDIPESTEVAVLLGVTVNETTNRLNGIINFAQLLLDSQEQIPENDEQRKMLQKIIETGNSIADDWRKIK